jgi:tetratricopeptide (TPR) repeat protein
MSDVEFQGSGYDEDLSYLIDLVEGADPLRSATSSAPAGTRSAAEGDQVVAAIERACESDPRMALRLVAGLSSYWWSRGLQDEAAAAAERVLGMLGRTVPAGMDEEYLLTVLHAASSAEQEQLELAQQVVLDAVGPFKYPVTVLLWALVFGPFESRTTVAEVLARHERDGDAWTRAAVELCKGYPGLVDIGPVEAEQSLRIALARFRMLEDRWAMFLALTGLRQMTDDLLPVTSEAVELAEELGLEEEAGLLLCERGELHLRAGEVDAARTDYRRALELADSTENLEAVAAARIGLARTARHAGNLICAREHLAAVLAESTDELADAREEAAHELAALCAAEATA